MKYRIVIAHGLGLLPEYNHSASALPWPHIIFWLPSHPWAINYYLYQTQAIPNNQIATFVLAGDNGSEIPMRAKPV